VHSTGVKCEIIHIPNGTHGTGAGTPIPGRPVWEGKMTEWRNTTLRRKGAVEEGIRQASQDVPGANGARRSFAR